MNMKTLLSFKYTLLLAIIGSMCFVVVAFHPKSSSVKLVTPKGWRKPIYNYAKNTITKEGFELGRKLFYDPVLSRDGTISCANCHTQYSAFTHVDHGFSHGINGLKGTRNSMVLFNLAWNKSFMWDGGVNNLEVQPLAPITSPFEMDNTLANVVHALDTSVNYKSRFYVAFGDSTITGQRVLKALAQFTGMMVSSNSKYDKYIRHEQGGDFSVQEMSGLSLFRKNCASCHTEPLFTDYSFKNTGLVLDAGIKDIGRMKITGSSDDSLKFRVPTLRNIEMSYPYMHDGRFKSLIQVLNHYTNVGVAAPNLAVEIKAGIRLSEQDKKDIIAFLETLTDKEFLFDERFKDHRD